jgi:hypothetical protein
VYPEFFAETEPKIHFFASRDTNKHKHANEMDSCDENCNSSNNEHTCKGEFKGKKRLGGPLTDGKKYARRTHRKTEDTVDTATKLLGNLGLVGYEDLTPQALFPLLGQIVSDMANKLMDLTNVEDKQSCLEVITKSLLSRLSDILIINAGHCQIFSLIFVGIMVHGNIQQISQ